MAEIYGPDLGIVARYLTLPHDVEMAFAISGLTRKDIENNLDKSRRFASNLAALKDNFAYTCRGLQRSIIYGYILEKYHKNQRLEQDLQSDASIPASPVRDNGGNNGSVSNGASSPQVEEVLESLPDKDQLKITKGWVVVSRRKKEIVKIGTGQNQYIITLEDFEHQQAIVEVGGPAVKEKFYTLLLRGKRYYLRRKNPEIIILFKGKGKGRRVQLLIKAPREVPIERQEGREVVARKAYSGSLSQYMKKRKKKKSEQGGRDTNRASSPADKKKKPAKKKKPVPRIHKLRAKVFKATQRLMKDMPRSKEKEVTISQVTGELKTLSRQVVKSNLEALELYGLLTSRKLGGNKTLFSMTPAAFTCLRENADWISRYLYRLDQNTQATTKLFAEVITKKSKDPRGLELRRQFRDLLVIRDDLPAALAFALEVSKYLDYRGPDAEAIQRAGKLFFQEPVPDESNLFVIRKKKPEESRILKKEKLLGDLDLYFRKIVDYPMLTRLGEVFLCIRARYENEEMNKCQDPELRKQIKRPAENQVVEGNLRLVVTTAKAYRPPSGYSRMDLIGVGNLGLPIAAANFEPQTGYRFSTYASFWIRHKIGLWIADSSRTVRVTRRQQDKDKRLKKQCLAQGIDPMYSRFDQVQALTGISMPDFENFLTRNRPVLSIHQGSSDKEDDKGPTLESRLKTSSQGMDLVTLRLLIETIVERTEVALREEWAKSRNLERDLEIWRLRVANDMFSAIEPVEALTLREIEKRMKLSHERVRQIEVKAREVLGRVAIEVLEDSALAASMLSLAYSLNLNPAKKRPTSQFSLNSCSS